jgi:hypothetical protein
MSETLSDTETLYWIARACNGDPLPADVQESIRSSFRSYTVNRPTFTWPMHQPNPSLWRRLLRLVGRR